MAPTATEAPKRTSIMGRMRNNLLTGLLVLAPSVVTVWVFFRLLNWMDNLLGRYLRFPALDYQRIPGLGLLATLLLLMVVGWLASWIGLRPLLRMWDTLLLRIPGVGIVYGSTKSLGDAFLNRRHEQPFKQVVLVPWPHENAWRIGFVTGRAGADVTAAIGEVEVVFVPHTPNPASGFVHYFPRQAIRYLDWPVEDGLKVIVSGGLVQPVGAPAKPVSAEVTGQSV